MTVTVAIRPEIEAWLLAKGASGITPRSEAVRTMLEFGDKHLLSFGEPVTRSLLHEGHRV